jgi:hypothetical protein
MGTAQPASAAKGRKRSSRSSPWSKAVKLARHSAPILGVLSFLAGGAWTFFDHLEKKQRARESEAKSYVERMSKPPVQPALQKLNEFWDPRANEVFAMSARGPLFAAYLDEMTRNNGLGMEVDTLASIYDEVRICTCSDRCDAELIRANLGRTAEALNSLANPYMHSHRASLRDPAYGIGLEMLGRAHRNSQAHDFRDNYCAGFRNAS